MKFTTISCRRKISVLQYEMWRWLVHCATNQYQLIRAFYILVNVLWHLQLISSVSRCFVHCSVVTFNDNTEPCVFPLHHAVVCRRCFGRVYWGLYVTWCAGIPDDRDGLFDTILLSKNQYQKRAYQCIKMLVSLFTLCVPWALCYRPITLTLTSIRNVPTSASRCLSHSSLCAYHELCVTAP